MGNDMSEKPMPGTWTLVAPDGRSFKAENPLKCCKAERDERITAEEQLDNLSRALFGICFLCDGEFSENEKTYTLAKGTPAEIGPLCGACKGSLVSSAVLAPNHKGMRVDHSGVLGRIAKGCKVRPDQRWILGEMDGHLEEMAKRFYAGEVSAVDEFLQLYCLDDCRPTSQAV
jgi:hypothetical protein